MGGGRKTQTIIVNDAAAASSLLCDGGTVSHRNLALKELGSVIFGCQPHTHLECLTNNLFGLPSGHLKYVKRVKHGMPLFLFNFTDRLMHGVFEATGPGDANINPHAWTEGIKLKTPFPAQVPVKIRKLYDPLHEDVFCKIISENYYKKGKFHFELDKHQTQNLIKLFESGNLIKIPAGKRGQKRAANAPDSSKCSESVDGWIIPKKPARKTIAAGKNGCVESNLIKLPKKLANGGFSTLKGEVGSGVL